MIHDESSFDLRQAPGIKVPEGYGAHFKSFDGKARNFIVEGNGGPSWFTEYNVLSGLSSRSFGRFSDFVTRIASGRVERGLPLALKGCGYQTLSLYPRLAPSWVRAAISRLPASTSSTMRARWAPAIRARPLLL